MAKMAKHYIDNTDNTSLIAYVHTDTIGEWVLIPKCNKIVAILDASGVGNSAKLQVTNDVNVINGGTVTDLYDWPDGIVTNAVVGVEIAPVMAVRQVISSGSTKLNLRAI